MTRLVRRLPRPVRALAADLDGDGLRDLVVAGFGHARGGISAHLARPGGGFEPVTLLGEPGAVSLALHGGDLYALMAQGDERLGRFAVIDAGDVTGDGTPDIVLGNLAYGAPGPGSPARVLARAWAAGPRFVVLEARPGAREPLDREPPAQARPGAREPLDREPPARAPPASAPPAQDP